MTRKITIEVPDVDDDRYRKLANAIWAVVALAAGLAGFTFRVRHDGDAQLSRELNEQWERYGTKTRWT